MFCKHDWKVISETTTKSKVEHAKELGMVVNKCSGFDLDRKFIQIVCCSKCGKLKRHVEDI